jgi:hypothetical protein
VDHSDAGLAWEILQRYDDPATAEFDATLDTAGLPPEVVRALRFWHRESVANVKQFASEVLPTVFEAVAAAHRDAASATRRAGVAFGAAQRTRDVATSGWDAAAPDVVHVPDAPGEPRQNPSLLEERRRTVAARLAELG